ncbi:major facilitator superfamily domain-containing protein [Syncephalastrum racemosum]|uniref:Major facilitator superfamily domain-containing protein n=1 Tax=Syncephalastrum racemosum TaxID=13706 RepID=A0A1X2HQ42_SYNRA|nr:major facilitator superfamily domain-containing protein [Syncephalastrum racemosum]
MSAGLPKETGYIIESAHTESRVYYNPSDAERGRSASSSTTSTAEYTQPSSERKEEYNGLYLFIIMSSLFLSLLLVSLDQCIVSTAIPVISASFHTLDQASWIGTSYILPLTVFQPLYGKLADAFGRKLVLLVSIAIFLIGSGLSGSSKNLAVLCVMRGVQGLGGAGIVPLVMVMIGDLVSARRRGKYQGMVALCWATGSIAGPLVGGALAQNAGWPWVFYINIPIGVVPMVIILFFFREPVSFASMRKDLCAKLVRLDLLGAALVMGAGTCFLLATQWGGIVYAWGSATIIGLYVGFVAFVLALLLVSWRISREPIMPLDVIGNRANLCMFGMAFSATMAMFINVYYLPIYFQVAYGDTPTMAGIELLPFLLPVDIVSISVGFIVSRSGRYRFSFPIGTALVTIGGGLQSMLNMQSSRGEQIGYLIVTGAGVGFCIQTMFVAAQASANDKPEKIGTYISLVSFFEYCGFASGVAVGSAIHGNLLNRYLQDNTSLTSTQLMQAQSNPDFIRTLSSTVREQVSDAYAQSLKWTFVAVAVCGAVGFIFSLGMDEHPLPKKKQTEKEEAS